MVYIETPRLLLRDWKEGDFISFAEMNKSPAVMEFFLHPLSEEESRSLLTLSGMSFFGMAMEHILSSRNRMELLWASQVSTTSLLM